MNYIEFLDEQEVECCFCKIPLLHVTKEVNITILDKNGIPVDQNNIYSDKLICPLCGTDFQFNKVGFGFQLGEQNSGEELIKKYKYNHNDKSNGFGFHNKED